MLTVEDGTGVANANSYVSVATAVSFLSARGHGFADEADYEPKLLLAMDKLKTLKYKGCKTASSNALPHPRKYAYDPEGLLYESDTIPQALIEAQIWLAYYDYNGAGLGDVSTAAIKSEKVDVLKTEFAVGIGDTTKLNLDDLPLVYSVLNHMLVSTADYTYA